LNYVWGDRQINGGSNNKSSKIFLLVEKKWIVLLTNSCRKSFDVEANLASNMKSIANYGKNTRETCIVISVCVCARTCVCVWEVEKGRDRRRERQEREDVVYAFKNAQFL